MHTYTQKPKATKLATSTKSTISTRDPPGRSSALRSIPQLQRTSGNQAVPWMLQADAQEHEAGLAGPASPLLGHGFSRIPVHSPSVGVMPAKPAVNNPGDEYGQESVLLAEHAVTMSKSKLQRACTCGGACPACNTVQLRLGRENLLAQRIQASATELVSAPTMVHEVLQSRAQPLDSAARVVMRPRFRHDFAGMAQVAPAINRPGSLQRKPLEIGAADDPFEREADQVAEHVMRARVGDPPHISAIRSSTTGVREAAPPIVEDVLEAAGQPLAPATRAFFEPKFGYDFSSIRLHANGTAAKSADATHARAYTVGDDIVFGRNQYQPEAAEGRRLLAHELAHSIQQSGHRRVMREPKAVVHPSVMPEIADKFAQLYAMLSRKARYRLYRNITIAIGVVTEKNDTEANEPRYVYTLSGNASSQEIDAAADQLGLTRWKPSARAEGRGAVGAPNDAEQLLEGGAETNHFDVWAVGVNRRLCADCAVHMGDAEIPARAFPDGAFRQGGALYKYQPPAGGTAGEGDSETAVVAPGGQGKPVAPPRAQGDIEPPSGTPATATKAAGGAGAQSEHESGEATPATGGASGVSQVGLHIGLGAASLGLGLLASYLKARVDAKIAQKQIDALLHVAGQRINAHPEEAMKKMMFAPEVTTYAWVFLNSSVINFFEANTGPEPTMSSSSPMIDIDSIVYAYQPVDPSITQNFLSGISGGGRHLTITHTLIIDIPLVTPPIENMFEYAKAHDIWLGGLRDYVMYRLEKSLANYQIAISDLELHRGTQKDIDKAELQNRYWQDLADRILAAEKKQTASAR